MKLKMFIGTLSCFLLVGCTDNSAPSINKQQEMYKNFINPPNRNRPQPFWHINGNLKKDYIYEHTAVQRKYLRHDLN